MGSLCICAQVSEMESDDNRTIPGCIPHQNLDESPCESLPLEGAMAFHGISRRNVVPGVGRRKQRPGKESPVGVVADYRQHNDYFGRGAGGVHVAKDCVRRGYACDPCQGEQHRQYQICNCRAQEELSRLHR